jgi:hypothetical protein
MMRCVDVAVVKIGIKEMKRQNLTRILFPIQEISQMIDQETLKSEL